MSKKLIFYLVTGILFTYFSLYASNFETWFDKIALILGITALILALFEYRKTKK